MCKTNDEKFKKYCGPFDIDEDTLEITKCFMRHGVHYAGYIGMMGSELGVNGKKFARTEGFHRGGVLVFPTSIQPQEQDLLFAEEYVIDYRWGHLFGGEFRYRGELYNATSLTMDINNWSDRKVIGTAKDIAHNRWNTDILCKVFPSNRIFLVKRK